MAEPGESLTGREREIVCLVATGATNRMIAQQLMISPNTVKVHLRNVFTKLEISSRTEATVIAIREGWVAVGDEQVDSDSALASELVNDEAKELVLSSLTALPPLPPLSWAKRVYLGASVLLVIVATGVAWPRTLSSAIEECSNEFTADCAVDGGDLERGEPESLWVSGMPMPQPRGRFAVVTFDGRLYLIGGETSEGVTGSVDVYDPQEDRWGGAADKPSPASNLAAVVLGERIYAVGGGDRQGEPLAGLEIYDPTSDSWSEGAPLPIPLAAHAAVAWQGKVYVFGGWNGTSYTGDALAYEPNLDRWELLPLLPTPRGFAGAAVVRDQIMVLGGYDGQREYAVCEKYDPQTGRWGECLPMQTPRGGIGIAAVAGQIYVIGGGWESFVTFSERYHPGSDAWYNVETPLLLTGGEWRNMGVAVVGTRIYALGGWQHGRYLNVNQAYETLPNRLYLPSASGG